MNFSRLTSPPSGEVLDVRSFCLPEILVAEERPVGLLDHDELVVERDMAGIAALGQPRVSGVEFAEVARLDRRLDGFDRLARRCLHHVGDRLLAKARPPAGDVVERSLELVRRVTRERPVLLARTQPQFGVARLNERVHEIGEAGIKRRRGRLRGRGGLRLDASRSEHAGDQKNKDKDGRGFEHRLSLPRRGEITPRLSSSAKLASTRRSATSGLPHRRRRRNIACMHFARQVLPAAVMLASLVGAAHAGPAGCELNKVAPARVVTKEPRLHFVASGGERTSGCPSAASACRLRAYVMPGDEVLVDLTDAAYVCAFFKSQGGTETRGWLPRA